MPEKNPKDRDPLYELFEHFLFNRSFEDSSAFTKEVATEYLGYLDSTPAHVPFHSRASVLKDLEAEAHELLIKRMYGCLKPPNHKGYGKVTAILKNKQLTTFDFPQEENQSESAKK